MANRVPQLGQLIESHGCLILALESSLEFLPQRSRYNCVLQFSEIGILQLCRQSTLTIAGFLVEASCRRSILLSTGTLDYPEGYFFANLTLHFQWLLKFPVIVAVVSSRDFTRYVGVHSWKALSKQVPKCQWRNQVWPFTVSSSLSASRYSLGRLRCDWCWQVEYD